MRIAMLTCALAAVLSTTARAQDLQLSGPFAFNSTSTEVSTQGPDDGTGPRVGVELLAGTLGGIGGGFTGLMIGVGSGDLATAGFGMLGGVALGSWLGISAGGTGMGGRGDWGASLLGTLLGSATSLVVAAAMMNSPDSGGLMLAMMVALPVGGGAIGYEVSHAMNFASAGGPLKSLSPSLSLSRDGKSPITGVSGTF